MTTSRGKTDAMTKEPMRLDLKAPHQKYFAKDGKQVCGVTTYLGVLGKDALMPWAAKMEREGVRDHLLSSLHVRTKVEGTLLEPFVYMSEVEEFFSTLPRPYFYAGHTSKAADLGTITHERVRAWLHGTTLDPEGLDPELYAASEAPLKRFQEWWDGEGLTLVASEEQLVHPELRYGGTIDFVARDKAGSLVLGDIKTTKANRDWPYPTVIAQVAAYRELKDANNTGYAISRVVVVRVGKTPEDLGQQVWITEKRLAAGMRLFLAAKDAYEAQREL